MRLILASLVIFAAACGGDDAGKSSLEGIYEKDSWSLKASGGCDAEGDSVLSEAGRDPFFVIYHAELLGVELLMVAHCASVPECRSTAADGSLFGLGFDSGSDSSGWTGGGATAGSSGGGTCQGEARDFTLEETAGAEATVSIVMTEAGEFPEDDEGFCTTDGARAAAEGMSCTGLERFTGTLVENP